MDSSLSGTEAACLEVLYGGRQPGDVVAVADLPKELRATARGLCEERRGPDDRVLKYTRRRILEAAQTAEGASGNGGHVVAVKLTVIGLNMLATWKFLVRDAGVAHNPDLDETFDRR